MFARRSAGAIGLAVVIGGIYAASLAEAGELREQLKGVARTSLDRSKELAGPCKELEMPSRLPGVNTFFDSAALIQNVTTADPSFRKKLTIAIGLTSTPSAIVIDGNDASPAVDSIFRVVIAALRPSAADSAQAFRIVLEGGKQLKSKMAKSEICAPKLVSINDEVNKPILRTGRVTSPYPTSGPPPGLPAAPRTSMPRVRIDVSGQVVDVTPDGKGGGVTEATRTLWMSKRFAPATLDGVAVESWYNGTKTELVAITRHVQNNEPPR